MADETVRINRDSTRVLTFTVLDELNAAVPASELDSATLTLIDVDTYVPGASPAEGILNGRDAQDVLNANDVTISESGVVVWTMVPEDNPIITPRRQIERHRALFTFAWATGAFTKAYRLEVDARSSG